MNMTERAIADGSLIGTRDVEYVNTSRPDPSWSHTDSHGHVHTAAGLDDTTYFPESYCVDCECEHSWGRACVDCDETIYPAMIDRFGPVDHGVWWTVDVYTQEGSALVRRCWTKVPDRPVIRRMIADGAIGPHVDALIVECGEPDVVEWSSS